MIEGLHKVFENRIRLGILSILMVEAEVDFNSLKKNLQVTDGNLASHLSGLEKQEIIQVRKQFVGKKPNTVYSMTSKGKKMFKEHLSALEKLISRSG